MRVRVKIKDNEFNFSSELAKRVFFERNNNKDVILEPDDAPTAEMRRFFEGCLVPVMFYAHPKSNWKDFQEARDAVKFEFLPHRTIWPIGRSGRIAIPISTTDLSKERFKIFINTVVEWMIENEVAPPDALDAENYKRWRDSAPAVGEIYPPLKRLKEQYDKAKTATIPPWRREKEESKPDQDVKN